MSSGRRPVSMAIWVGGLDLGGPERVQAGAQHGHDLRRQVPPGFAARGPGGDVAEPEREIAGQPGRGLPGPGQAQARGSRPARRGRPGR